METETFVLMPKRVLDDINQIKINVEQIKHAVESTKKVGETLYYTSQVARLLRKAPKTIKKMIEAGVLRSTANGLIPESAIESYLKGD
ncbi:MAG: DNA-binding protein [Alphaproteobacteria bacterium]|nr:DNA-binding protein [Alphaproteobacteria bacterium]